MTMSHTIPDIASLQTELHGQNPRTILKAAFKYFSNIAISFSGAEDVVLIDMALSIKPAAELQVFSLDTGRLHPETYRFIEKVREHYGLAITVLLPDAEPVNALVREKGLYSFYREGHHECCGLRKVAPLRRHLARLDAWITGQRRDQSQETRQDLPEVQIDTTFSSAEHTVVKFNPLSNWRSAQVWDYIEAYRVPYNALHAQGYMSIGCEPCTRPVLPNQHERVGRWWWEDEQKKECGLHAGNLRPG